MKRTNTAVWYEKYGRWQIKVQKDGKRRTFMSSKPGRAGQREANAKADAWLEGDILDEKARVREMYKEFEESVLSRQAREKVEQLGRLYILPALATRKVGSLLEDDFQTILERAAVKGVGGEPLSKKSLANHAAIMKQFMKFCRRKKLTSETLEFLTVPKSAKVGEKHILQPKDIVTLFTVDSTIMRGKRVLDTYIHAYRFAVLTGVRPGELIGLEWEDIQGKRVRLQRSFNEDGEITTGKNENARRSFVLTDIAQKELEKQAELTKEQKRVFGIESQSTYRHRWMKYCEANGMPYISPYEMRHTFVSVAKNLTEGQVKALVGHSYNMDTFGVYGHEVQGEQIDTAKQLNNLFSKLLKRRVRRPNARTKWVKIWVLKNKKPA